MSEAGLGPGGALGAVPYLRPHPGAAEVFSRRARRLAALAPGHAAGEYLSLLSRVAAAQAGAAARLSPPTWPGGGEDGPPLDASGPWPTGWTGALDLLLPALLDEPAPAVRAALELLAGLDEEGRAARARRLVRDEVPAGELPTAPLLAAALQVTFTLSAAALPPAAVARVDSGCPCCGSAPAVGVILGDDKLRYLWCGLCATAWHHTRLQCVRCRSAARLEYLEVEGAGGAAKAEACLACGAYLKLLYLERAPAQEPLADDLGTLALDLLVAERGLAPLGRNLLLVQAAG